MYLTGVLGCVTGFARALRVAFQHNNLYHYDPNPAYSKIFIYDEFPYVPMKFPAIVPIFSGGPALLRGIGEEFAYQEDTQVTFDGMSSNQINSITYSGNLRPTVELRIYARSAYDLAQIADWTVLFLRHFAVDKFRAEGVLIEDVSIGSQSVQMLGADPLYQISVSVRCLTSFVRAITIPSGLTIDAICITSVFTVLPDGVCISP